MGGVPTAIRSFIYFSFYACYKPKTILKIIPPYFDPHREEIL